MLNEIVQIRLCEAPPWPLLPEPDVDVSDGALANEVAEMIFGDVKPKGRLLGCEQRAVVVGGIGQEHAPAKNALLTSPAESDALTELYTVDA